MLTITRMKCLLHSIPLGLLALVCFVRPAAAIVGYYNVNVTPGWNLLANQLILSPNNSATNVLTAVPVDGSLLYRFNPVTQAYYEAATYFTGVGWYPTSGNFNDASIDLPLGEGFVIWSPSNWVATIVGEVPQGSLTNPLPAGFSLQASMVPQAGTLQSSLLFPPYNGDQVWRWVAPGFSAFSYDANMLWQPSQPSLNVGESFFLYRSPDQATPDHWWIRNFTVALMAGASSGFAAALAAPTAAPGVEITSIRFREGQVVLTVKNDSGASYAMQFSSDGVVWTTVATGLTGTTWQEPVRAGAQGYYQVVNP